MKRSKLLFLISLLALVACSKGEKTGQSRDLSGDAQGEATAPKTVNPIPVAEEDIGRTEWQNPELVLSSMGDLSQKVVADIGAGSGYFAFKMAQSAEKVIALDIDPKALEYIDKQIEIVGEWAKKVETRLTQADSPNLNPEEVDAVLIVNTYFYIPNRATYLEKLLVGLKENGKLVIVDYKIGDSPVGPSNDFRVKPEEIENELRSAGYKSVSVDLQSLQYQYVISAEKHK